MQRTHTPIISRLKVPLVLALLVGVVFAVPASRQATLELFSFGEPEMETGVYFTCPMHPDIRLSQAGDCPICGMSLVEKEAGEGAESTGAISVTAQQIQLTGITVELLKRRKLFREIDAYGKIDYDETRREVVSAWVGGRIERLYVDFTGVTVNKGHALVDLYSPDLISTKREYLLAVENLEKVKQSGFTEAVTNAAKLIASTRQRLKWLGLNDTQINSIEKSEDLDDHVRIYAPRGGTVIHKQAYAGMYVKEGDVLFHIADLSRVWLYADIYEDEIGYLYEERPGDYFECTMHPEVTSDRPGTCRKCGMELIRANQSLHVDISTRAFPGEAFKGYISFTDPFLNPETRTVRVRVNIDNPDLKLKPNMFARAKIQFPVGEMLAVPENAVIHSGTRKIVLVEEEKGQFRPKLVRLGRLWLNDVERASVERKTLDFQRESLRYHEVIAGLSVGEKIVTSGNFLLGSESQLQGALAKMLEEADDTETDATETEGDTGPKNIEEKDFALLLESYLGIQEKLANDTVEGIPALAEKIMATAQNAAIKKAAEPLRHAEHKNDIKAVRQDFRQISDVMIAYISVHREHLKDLPRKAYCPMADADWIQTADVLANPYYGASMLRCGTFKEWNRNDG